MQLRSLLKRYQDCGATGFCFDILPETEGNAGMIMELIRDEMRPALG